MASKNVPVLNIIQNYFLISPVNLRRIHRSHILQWIQPWRVVGDKRPGTGILHWELSHRSREKIQLLLCNDDYDELILDCHSTYGASSALDFLQCVRTKRSIHRMKRPVAVGLDVLPGRVSFHLLFVPTKTKRIDSYYMTILIKIINLLFWSKQMSLFLEVGSSVDIHSTQTENQKAAVLPLHPVGFLKLNCKEVQTKLFKLAGIY